MWGETVGIIGQQVLFISIHSPRVGRDLTGETLRHTEKEISIHSPHAG